MKVRPRQRALPLDGAAPDASRRWHDGARLSYLGEQITISLAGRSPFAELMLGVLHLPLPPQASPRQIEDAACAWLQQQALSLIGACVRREGERQGKQGLRWRLSFAARGGFALHADGSLRFNWRLVEQPDEVMAEIVRRGVAAVPPQRAQLALAG